MTIINTLYGTRPIIVHASGPLNLSPLWPRLYHQVLADGHLAHICDEHSFTFFTWDSGGQHVYTDKTLGTAQLSLGRLGLTAHVLGHGLRPWRNLYKISTMLQALPTVTTPYVIATDSPDVLVLDCPQPAVDLLIRSGAEMLFIGDSSFWPPELADLKGREERIPGAGGTPFGYLNSGAFVARTDFCRYFFQRAAELAAPQFDVPHVSGTTGAETDSDDQSVLKRLYVELFPAVQLDYRCEIFQTLTWQDESILQME